MRFGLLGSLEVVGDDGAPLDLGGAQPRKVLAMLLAAGGRVVTADALIGEVWGDAPPASAGGTLQSYISRLRRSLEPDRDRGAQAKVLLYEPPGYRLAVDGADVDFRRFEALADEGRQALTGGQPDDARRILLEADALWRGPALIEYRDHEFAIGLVTRLEDRRLAAIEDRIDSDLALGRHAPVIGELNQLVQTYPLQERLRAQLALALYRAGRQAEALRALDDARTTLRDELGLEPNRELRDLERAILDHDPALEGLAPTAARSPGHTTGAVHARPPATAGGTRFVGREAELLELTSSLDEAAATTRAAVVEGEPGIGKTRLVEELAAQAAERGVTVLWGRAFEGGAAPAFWPWLPPLRALVEARTGADPLNPEIANLLSVAAEAPELPAAGAGRFVLFDAVSELLAEAAARRPLLLVIDDVQWADVASLELLASVVGRSDAPILVVVTVRQLDVGRNDALVETLAALSRHTGARRLTLRGLLPDQTAALVAQTTGDDVDTSTLELIQTRADGNPFFTTELARLVVTGAPIEEVPSGVRDVVRRRLSALPDATATLLEVASIIGRDAPLDLLARVANVDLDRCLDDLEPAVVQRLLVPAPDQPFVYRFVHALVREVLADGMSTLRRARVHLQVADALDDSDDTAEIRAEHLWNAAPIGAGRRAAEALERAALVAIRRLAYDSAIDLLERAVPLRRAVGTGPEEKNAELDALSMLVAITGSARGQAVLIGSPLIERGKQLARETGRQLEELSLVWVEWAGWDQACDLDKAEALSQELSVMAEATDAVFGRTVAHVATGITDWQRGRITRAVEHMEEATRLAKTIPGGEMAAALFDRDQLRLPYGFAVYLHTLVGDQEDTATTIEQMVDLIPDDAYWELIVNNFIASGAMTTGDADRCERAARRGVEIDPDGVSAFWSMTCRCYLGVALCQQGRIDEGVPYFEEAWRVYTAAGLRVNGVGYTAEVALAMVKAGRRDGAERFIAESERLRSETGERFAESILLLAQAALAHLDGEMDQARELGEEARALATAQGSHAVAARIEREVRDLLG